ncbi:MAG: DoxX family protein [Ignavibacteriae bacterium]|nr:MAG: DoxX family protein [Ignavibacteriota bacterium]
MKFLDKYKDLGVLLLRLGIGITFITIHGLPKILGGPESWARTGKAMSNLGITFYPEFWGFMAGFTELAGGLLLIAGLFVRPASVFLSFVMIMAMTQHLLRMDPWNKALYPFEMLAVFAALFFTGAGKYSLDYFISKRKKSVKLSDSPLELHSTKRQAQI